MAEECNKLSYLIPDDRNANKHSESGMAKLEKGLRENGLGRSILISSDNKIIAGNGVTESAGIIGIEDVQIVDSDGTKVIAVRRTDIKSGTREFYNMALSDNIIAKENIVMDAEVVDAICEEYDIEEWKGIDYSKGHEANNLSEDDLDFLEQFDPVGKSKGLQRVVFIFDGAEEAQSWINKTDSSLPMVKRNMAWQVNLSTQFT